MRRSIIVWFIGIALLAASGAVGQDSDKTAVSNVIAISNTTVVDVESGKANSNQSILIKNGRIVFVGSAPQMPAIGPAVEIDGEGKFAIPGLWDMHIHAYSPSDMQLFPINGVVGVRLMWGMPMHHAWRKQFDSGEKLGPRMMIASAIIDGPKPIWPGSIVAADVEAGVEAVEKAIAAKADFAKVYSLLPRDAYFSIAKSCGEKGLPFDGHVPSMISVAEASDIGQRSMEHMYGLLLACSSRGEELRKIQADFVEQNDGEVRSLFSGEAPGVKRRAIESYDEEVAAELFRTLKTNQTWQCPTLTVLRNLAYLETPEVQDNPNLKYINPAMRNFIAPKKARRPQTEEEVQFERRLFAKNLEIVKAMHESGVPIIAGTDVLNPFCLPGFSLHTELQLMVRAGLSPGEALKTATINAAKFQRKENEMGSISKGKVADIVLLNANPLTEISNTKKIDTVIYGGKVYDREKLDEMLEGLAK